MTRTEALRSVLTHVIELHPLDAVAALEHDFTASKDPYLLSLLSFALCFGQRFEQAAEAAARAVAAANDAETTVFAKVATAWAASTWLAEYEGDPLQEASDDIAGLTGADPNSRAFILYWLAEAALGSARLDLAARVVERTGDLPSAFLNDDQGRPHPYLAMMQIMRARLLAFQGRVTDALAVTEDITAVPGTPGELLVAATQCLLVGNNAERQSARAIADRLEIELGEPSDYISAGCYILVSYGLVAMGDIARAAQFVLRAGHTAGLEGLNIIDRALGLEMLVAAAVAQNDLDAAQAWQAQAASLLSHPIARPTIERLNSRIALLAGDAASAAEWAELAVEHATVDGRAMEVAEGEIVLSRARVALSERGVANSRLEAMAARAAASGHPAAQKSAARELRLIGRRLRPTAGTGWSGLSARERDVALLVAEGFGNQEIARDLHLSEHTVQAHVSRVLAAFGAASRVSVATQLTGMLPVDPLAQPPAELTPRQQTVAAHIALGKTNDSIAVDLGVSVKTVEKHVSEIRQRWQVASRIGIARLALASNE